MYIKPYSGEEIGRGKSGFAVNWGVVHRGFTYMEHMPIDTHMLLKACVSLFGKLLFHMKM